MPEKGPILELAEYIKKNIRKGYTMESLRWALINQGYSRIEIEKAINKANFELASKAPILKTKPVIRHEVIDFEKQAKKKSLWERMFR